MSNPQRGYVNIELDGTKYTLALTFEAIAGIEGRLRTGVTGVLGRFVRSEAGFGDAEAVLIEGIKASGEKPPKNLREIITKEGILKLSGPLSVYLSNALTGGQTPSEKGDDSGEAKAEA